MPYPEKIQRNEEIFALVEIGVPMERIAETFSISYSRVWQIYNFVGRKKFSSLNLNYKEEKNNG